MYAEIPQSWTGSKLKFFFQHIHKDSQSPEFPKNPKFFIGGKYFDEKDRLDSYINEVKILVNLL